MHRHDHLTLRLASTDEDLRAAERLRYRVFVEELGGDGPLVDHQGRFERDRFDPFFDHLILVDTRRDADALEHVVGVYRLMSEETAEACGQFYSADEYDLSPLLGSGRKILELGRSCVHPDFRRGVALHLLWRGLADYVESKGIEILFGVASFHGTDPGALAEPLSHLYHTHLAPPALRVRTREAAYQPMDLVPAEAVDRVTAMKAVPALIKSYLRLGGYVGDGAFVDHAFNTTDICLILDTAELTEAMRQRLARGPLV